MTIKTSTLSEAIDHALEGRRVMTTCPAHDDGTPSLSVAPGDTQPVVLTCHAQCETEAILEAAGLGWDAISKEPEKQDTTSRWTPAGTASNVYPYYDSNGSLSYEVLRVVENGKKRFFQRQPDDLERSGYRWNLDGVERLLYRLPQVIEAVNDGSTIAICEGEKCVEALQPHLPNGDQATCNSGGAKKFTPEMADVLAGANVVIYADADEPGREHARMVHEMLTERGCVVQILETPGGRLPNGKPVTDIADHLEAGLSLSQMLETTPGSTAERARSGVDVLEVIDRPPHDFEYIIPGTLARSERLLMVGKEGGGKSEFMRQFAFCTAAGINPISTLEMPAKRVLYIDAENHPGQTLGRWKAMHQIVKRYGGTIEPGMLTILEEWDSEIDLTTMKGRTWLKERVHAYRPDLLLMGPLKNLVQRNLSDHETVNQLRYTINSARSISECAVIMEHHAPLRMSGDRERELRPYGSGLFLGWPDFGYALKPSQHDGIFEWQEFRSDRVRGRAWPDIWRWGGNGELPWMPDYGSASEVAER